ncbi:MAG: hypothetical protein IPK74_34755 [Deltaproteobacteria bacterium]|nr:hypothetical protein [Deltaproteobacteria bacterium]
MGFLFGRRIVIKLNYVNLRNRKCGGATAGRVVEAAHVAVNSALRGPQRTTVRRIGHARSTPERAEIASADREPPRKNSDSSLSRWTTPRRPRDAEPRGC